MHHVKIPISDQALLNNRNPSRVVISSRWPLSEPGLLFCFILFATSSFLQSFSVETLILFNTCSIWHFFCSLAKSSIFPLWFCSHICLVSLSNIKKSSVVLSLSVLKLQLKTPVLKNLSFLFSWVSSFHTSVQESAFTALSFVFTVLSPRFCFHSLGFHIECSKPQRSCSSEWHEPTLINLWHMPWMIAHWAFCYDSVKELQLMPLPAQLSGAPALQTNC